MDPKIIHHRWDRIGLPAMFPMVASDWAHSVQEQCREAGTTEKRTET